MILELDAGNTRIKWRLRKRNEADNKWFNVADGFVFAREKTPSVFIDLGRQLEKLPMERISRMLVASVRGDGFKNAFSSLMTEKWHLQPEFATSVKACCGVTNAYADVGKLGVDRWLAMLAAYQREKGACCIVDCGTTITVDLVDANGRHEGGYIVPGLQLLRDSLAARSKALATEQSEWRLTTPGTSTVSAVHNGILRCAVGFMRDMQLENEKSGVLRGWYFTGGDANVLLPHVDWQTKHESDLVLDGLELAMFSQVEFGVVS
ncbi:MAG: type III pantothenate kinase [Pseudomonadota bacterium]